MSFSPYQKKSPGDVLKLQDWLEIQRRIKEELRDHRHLGEDRDGDVAAESLGPRIERGAFSPGAITPGKLAKGSVGPLALIDGAIRGEHFDPDQRLTESYLRFRQAGGHDHDGVTSRALPTAAVDTRQLVDGAIGEVHLEGTRGDSDLSADEETYARGRAFTPGNVLRAVRQLIEHTGIKQRPLLIAGAYQAVQGTPLVLRGFLLDELIGEGAPASADFLWLEFRIPDDDRTERTQAQVVDSSRVRGDVPALGATAESGWVRVVRGAGSEGVPLVPVTGAVAFTYQPSDNGAGS